MSEEDAVKAAVLSALSIFNTSEGLQQLRLDDVGEGPSDPQRSPLPAVSDTVWVIPSTFPQRRATVWVQPADRALCDDGSQPRHVTDVCGCVRPRSPRTGATAPPPMGGGGVESMSVALKAVVRRGSPYQGMCYILADNVTPFTALLATMAYNGFTPLTHRQALTDRASWSFKWIKYPARGEFVRMDPCRYQKINHIPGTQRLGHKAQLHLLLTEAEQRWTQVVTSWRRRAASHSSFSATTTETDSFHPCPPHRVFPEAWVVPTQQEACVQALRAPANRGQLFIVKPCGSAAGQGIFLVKGGPHADVNVSRCVASEEEVRCVPISSQNMAAEVALEPVGCTEERRRPREWVVQRYVPRPYLLAGHKFDLRLYVVVTSYWPLRLYLYQEGLVRIASTPYYIHTNEAECDTACRMADPAALTAHLTNFTVNKNAAAEQAHACVSESNNDTEQCHNHHPRSSDGVSPQAWPGTKWSLAALAAYMSERGDADYSATMRGVSDALVRLFASAVPQVRESLRSVDEERLRVAGQSSTGRSPPCTFKGISPFFEIYGVDVLLEHSSSQDGDVDDLVATVKPAVLQPVVMEVNIMPSLSTHYSVLDQSIKGHFVADALTLVGLTSTRFKSSLKPTLRVSEWPPRDAPPSAREAASHTFLASLAQSEDLEVCMTAEEEQRRATHARFTRLAPTSTSFQTYWPLLSESPRGEELDSHWDKLLSDWEQCKEDAGAL